MLKLKRRLLSIMMAGSIIFSTGVVALAKTVQVEGGSWDYGTSLFVESWTIKKKVYSNYYHQKKVHKSTCEIGTTSSSSDWVAAGKTSYSSAVGSRKDTGYAYYAIR